MARRRSSSHRRGCAADATHRSYREQYHDRASPCHGRTAATHRRRACERRGVVSLARGRAATVPRRRSAHTHARRTKTALTTNQLWSRTSDADCENGRSVPTAALHVAFLVAAAGLCFAVLPSPFWRSVGLLLVIVGTISSTVVRTWWLLFLLGMSQLTREPSPSNPVFYLLLAGVHLLHVLGSVARLVSWRGRLQLRSCVLPFRRILLVQLVVQPVSAGVLLVFDGGRRGTVPNSSILAALMLGAIAALFLRRKPS